MATIVNGKRVLTIPWTENTSSPDIKTSQTQQPQQNQTPQTDQSGKRVLSIPKQQTTQPKQQTTQPKQQTTPIEQPTTPQPIALDYETADLNRQKEIVDHLNYYAQANPASMRDIATFRSNYNYNKRSDTQKTVLDNWYFWYDEWRTLSQQPVQSLAQGYLNKSITQRQLDSLKTYDSNKYQQVIDSASKWQLLSQYQQQLNPQTINPFQNIINAYTTQLQQLSTTPSIYDQYKNRINSPELTSQRNKITDYETQINEIDDQLNNLRKDIERRYEWSGATTSAINAIYSDEANELMVQKNNLSRQMQAEATNYNWQLQAVWQELELQQQDYQMQQQALSTQMQQLWMIQSLMSFQTPQQKADIEWSNFIRQQEYAEWNIYSNDPATRRRAVSNAVDNVLKEFSGIPMYRSREQMIQDIQNLVDNWTDLWTAITQNIRDPIMDKPEYKSRINQKFPPQTVDIGWLPYKWDSSGNLEPVSLWQTYAWSWMTGQWLKNNNPWNIKDTKFWNVIWVWKNNMAQFATPEDWFDALVEKIKFNQTNKNSRYYGDTIAQYFTKYAPSGDGNNPQAYAQSVANALWVGINTKISQLDPVKFAAQIAKHDSWYNYSTYWQFRGWTTTSTTTSTTTWYNTNNNSIFEAYAKEWQDGLGKTGWERDKSLADAGYSSWTMFQKDYMNWAKEQVKQPDQAFKDAVSYVADNPLFDYTDENGIKHKGILWKAWRIDTKYISKIQENVSNGKRRDANTPLNSILNIRQLDELSAFVNAINIIWSNKVIDILKTWEVKLYPMSDADISLLKTSTWFGLNNFVKWTKIANALNNMNIAYQTTQTTQTPQQTSWYDMSWVWWYSSNSSNNSNDIIDISYRLK